MMAALPNPEESFEDQVQDCQYEEDCDDEYDDDDEYDSESDDGTDDMVFDEKKLVRSSPPEPIPYHSENEWRDKTLAAWLEGKKFLLYLDTEDLSTPEHQLLWATLPTQYVPFRWNFSTAESRAELYSIAPSLHELPEDIESQLPCAIVYNICCGAGEVYAPCFYPNINTADMACVLRHQLHDACYFGPSDWHGDDIGYKDVIRQIAAQQASVDDEALAIDIATKLSLEELVEDEEKKNLEQVQRDEELAHWLAEQYEIHHGHEVEIQMNEPYASVSDSLHEAFDDNL